MTANIPFGMHVEQFSEDEFLRLKFDLNDDVFDKDKEADVRNCFEKLLNEMVADWGAKIESVRLVETDEYHARVNGSYEAGTLSSRLS